MICDSWVHSFECFMEDMGHRPEGMTLGRIDNDKGYSKNNCSWQTDSEQNKNRRPPIHKQKATITEFPHLKPTETKLVEPQNFDVIP